MSRRRNCGWIVLGVCVGALALEAPARRAAPPRETVLLVAPARARVLQIAMDMATLRGAGLVSYRGEPAADDPLLFAWRRGDWQYVAADRFREGAFLNGPPPRQVVIIGGDEMLPAAVPRDALWGAETTRLKSLQAADLINGLDLLFHFTPREWTWLAGRYGLTLTDVNMPRRAYNPYDVRRSQLPVPRLEGPPPRPGEPPPAVLIEPDAKPAAAPPPVAAPSAVLIQPDAGTTAAPPAPPAADPTLK